MLPWPFGGDGGGPFPKYSPDLNPMDYFVWSETERRMALREPRGETVAQYKARLRRTALALPEALVRKAVAAMRHRARAVIAAKSGNTKCD